MSRQTLRKTQISRSLCFFKYLTDDKHSPRGLESGETRRWSLGASKDFSEVLRKEKIKFQGNKEFKECVSLIKNPKCSSLHQLEQCLQNSPKIPAHRHYLTCSLIWQLEAHLIDSHPSRELLLRGPTSALIKKLEANKKMRSAFKALTESPWQQ